MNLQQLIQANTYTTSYETCSGCENHCQVKLFRFANGKTFASGNNCEKVYSSYHEAKQKGTNLFQEKYRLLFAPSPKTETTLTIGIPRGLGIYENYPFWRTLFEQCHIRPVLSSTSTNTLYEKGVRTIMADNICFPAKLMHGHVMDLIDKKVDRIFYPFVVYEQKEDERSRNSFNCPIVSAYSDVLKSAIDPEHNYGIPFDAPVISFANTRLLTQACVEYLATLGITKEQAQHAVQAAIEAQQTYLSTLRTRAQEILAAAQQHNRMVILLAGRPYHTDPLIEHKISTAIADMGIDVITEHIATEAGQGVYDELNAVTQWAYPNRIFKAAYFAAHYPTNNLQIVQLTSFGCGPDAFILDEVQTILSRYHKNLTILKIDDVNNIGSLKLRIRSLVESVATTAPTVTTSPEAFKTTKIFTEQDKERVILAPYFAEGYSEFIVPLMKLAGYKMINLPMGTQEDAETGLRYANNDVCYPATIVIGSIMNALNSGQYDLNRTAVIITQTGGQCRATNYYSLIKNAMVQAGYDHVPLISLATSADISALQPGFHFSKSLITHIIHTMAYADAVNRLYHSAAVRIKPSMLAHNQTAHQLALSIRNRYIQLGIDAIEKKNHKLLQHHLRALVNEYNHLIDPTLSVPVMGLVGEIYVKYNSFSHKNVVNWLLDNGIEVIPPSIIEFFSTSFVANHANRTLHVREEHTPTWLTDTVYRYIRHIVKQYDKICAPYPFYRPSANIFDIARLSQQVISTAADFGEGWFLPGEICHLAETGVNNVISLQPFGCIANHVISKGIEKKLRTIYPHVNMLFLDFDSSTSDANIYNRLHFLVDNARKG